MTNFAALKSRVEGVILDTNTAVVAEIPGYIRKAQAELEDDRALQVLEASWTTDLAEGEQTLTKPDDYNGLRTKPYRVNDDGTNTFLEMLGSEVAIGSLDTDDTGAPRLFVDDSYTELLTYPLADAEGTFTDKYRIVSQYWKRLAALTEDSDTNWFSDNAEDYLIWRASELAFDFNRDAMADKYLVKAIRERKRLRGAAIRARFPSGWVLKPNQSSELSSRHRPGRHFKPSHHSIHEGPI